MTALKLGTDGVRDECHRVMSISSQGRNLFANPLALLHRFGMQESMLTA